MTAPILTQDILKELIHYNPDTGIFTWLERHGRWFSAPIYLKIWNTKYSNKTAGTVEGHGYISIGVLRIYYKAHRLAFLYMKGAFPKNETDHINGVRTDNRWLNLRDVTREENTRNRAISRNNTSGHMGVFWDNTINKWASRITVSGNTKHLGFFREFEDAVASRIAGEVRYGFHPNHGRPLKEKGA